MVYQIHHLGDAPGPLRKRATIVALCGAGSSPPGRSRKAAREEKAGIHYVKGGNCRNGKVL
jgi:hypothetical protein